MLRRAAARRSEIVTGDLLNIVENGLFIEDSHFDDPVDPSMGTDAMGESDSCPDSLRGGSRGLP